MSIGGVLAIGLMLFASEASADPKYMMPRDLVEHSRQLGCSQVEDFFNVEGMIGPPYAYGYLPGRIEDSAVFWCEKHKDAQRSFLLAIAIRPGHVEGALACSRVVSWHDYPGGLDIYRDPSESLDSFVYLDDPRRKGPHDKTIVHNAIRSSVPGGSTTFYCHEGRWLVRSRH